MSFSKLLFRLGCVLLFAGCVAPNGVRPSLFGSLGNGARDNTDSRIDSGQSAGAPAMSPNAGASATQRRPRVETAVRGTLNSMGELKHVEGNVWRSRIDAVQLFNMMSRLLSQNYLLTSVDRKNLSLNTDWDKFFIEGRLFRNRLSVSVFPVGYHQTEVVVKNSVEYYAGSTTKPEEVGLASWLPSPDITDEVTRIVDSLNSQIAFYQNQSTYR